jgi:hypothetical protein
VVIVEDGDKVGAVDGVVADGASAGEELGVSGSKKMVRAAFAPTATTALARRFRLLTVFFFFPAAAATVAATPMVVSVVAAELNAKVSVKKLFNSVVTAATAWEEEKLLLPLLLPLLLLLLPLLLAVRVV